MRRSYYTGKYELEKERKGFLIWYTRHYKIWAREYNALTDSVKSINFDGMPHGMGAGKPTEILAERRAQLRGYMEVIEQSIREASPDMYEYFFKAFINGYKFKEAKTKLEIPCERTYYYETKRKYLNILDKKIKF